MSPADAHLLFAYGTLRDPVIQKNVFNRVAPGVPDALKGFSRTTVTIGKSTFPNLRPDPEGRVEGRLLTVTAAELFQADVYESHPYIRMQVTLESGRVAWVYYTSNA